MVLDQVKVADTSYEITAIPKPPDMLTIKGAARDDPRPARPCRAGLQRPGAPRAPGKVPARDRGEDHRQGG